MLRTIKRIIKGTARKTAIKNNTVPKIISPSDSATTPTPKTIPHIIERTIGANAAIAVNTFFITYFLLSFVEVSPQLLS